MTLTEEKRFVVLLSIFDCKGQGSKRKVLDNIEARGYYYLTSRDLQDKQNRNEKIWRNELAFTRRWLVRDKYLDDRARDCWTITNLGRSYLKALCEEISNESNLSKLTPAAVNRSKQILSSA